MSSSLGSPMDWEPSETYNPENKPHPSYLSNSHPQQSQTAIQSSSVSSASSATNHLAKRSFAEFVQGQDNEVKQPPPAQRRDTSRGVRDVAAYTARLPLRIPSIIRGIARCAKSFVRNVGRHAYYRRNVANGQAAGLVQTAYLMPGSFVESPPSTTFNSLHNKFGSHSPATTYAPPASETQPITPHTDHQASSSVAKPPDASFNDPTPTRLNLKRSFMDSSGHLIPDPLPGVQRIPLKKPRLSHHAVFEKLREAAARSPEKPLTYKDLVRFNRLAMYSSPDRVLPKPATESTTTKSDSMFDKARSKYYDVLEQLISYQKAEHFPLSYNLNPVTTVFSASFPRTLPDLEEEEPSLGQDWIPLIEEETGHSVKYEGKASDASSVDSDTYSHVRRMLASNETDHEAEAALEASERFNHQQPSPKGKPGDDLAPEGEVLEISPARTSTTEYSNDLSLLPDASPLPPRKHVRFQEAAFPTLWAYEKDKPFPEREREYDPEKAMDEPLSPLGTPRFSKYQEQAEPVTPDQLAPPSPDISPRLPRPVSSPRPPPNTPVNTPVEIKETIDAFGLFKLSGRADSSRYHRQIEIERAAIEAAKERKRQEEAELKRAEEQRKQEEEEERKRVEEERRKEEERRIEEARREEERRLEEARKEEERKAKLRIVKPLSGAMTESLDAAMSSRDPLKTFPPFNLTRKDLGTVLPQSSDMQLGWLNDEVINEFLSGVVSSARAQTGYNKSANDIPKYVAFSTHLYPTMQHKGYSAIARWVTRAKIAGKRMLDVETILIPIHEGNHWTLLEISGTNRTVSYYDSLSSGESTQVSGRVQKYLDFGLDFIKQNLGREFDAAGWRLAAGVSVRQQNGKDCGIFVCLNGLALVAGLRPKEALEGVAPLLMREQVAATLLTGFEGDFAFNVL